MAPRSSVSLKAPLGVSALALAEMGDDCVNVWESKSGSPHTVPITHQETAALQRAISEWRSCSSSDQ